MLRGFDTSHHQTDNVFNHYLNSADFMIVKATEGRTYIDPKFNARVSKINNNLCGVYHYARPENNTPQAEADNFIDSIKSNKTDSMLLILDWEGNSLSHSFDWALEWCKIVEDYFQIKPIIYASASTIKKYKDRYNLWWTAHYNNDCIDGCIHDGVEEIMTQYTSKPIDIDIFHGTSDDWLRLCGVNIPKEYVVASWTDGSKMYQVICKEV